jgi:Tol biopolymer transport system component
MVAKIFGFVLLTFFTSASFAQQFEFCDVTKLGGGINSPAEESMPLLSADGKKLYFTRALSDQNEGGIYGGQDVWVSEFARGTWNKATNKLSINTKDNNTVIGVDKDGKILYFLDASHGKRLNGIYMTRVQGTRLSKPELIPIPGIANLDFIGFYVSPDRDVIFISMKASDSRGEDDLYYTTKSADGTWGVPKNLGATINTSGFEIAPFLSADKKRLYFSSNGHPGMGDADIFYSERVYESWETWSVPVNLGPVINSKKFDSYFSIYGDSIAFFASNRDGKYAEIYNVTVRESK